MHPDGGAPEPGPSRSGKSPGMPCATLYAHIGSIRPAKPGLNLDKAPPDNGEPGDINALRKLGEGRAIEGKR